MEFKERMQNAGVEFVNATKMVADAAVKHTGIAAEEYKIREQYRILGRLLYEAYEQSPEEFDDFSSEFFAAFHNITISKEKIEELKENNK
ncbi:MAG: hypothetical protein K6G65_02410 [Lachnospiraceae bacterium]|nr:hypothetical protein [Lachnospiraceae bacterium]